MLDTNIIVEILRGKLAQPTTANMQLYACSIVLGELYFGARKSLDPTAQIKIVDKVAQRVPIIDCDTQTSLQYSIVRHALESSGSRIPENDMWIAALAIQHQLILVTRDTHFGRISGLTIEAW